MNPTELQLCQWEDALEKAKWRYLGSGFWMDPQTETRLSTTIAYKVLTQREKRIRILKSLPKPKTPKLILCSDWKGITRELRKQLSPHGLTVKIHTKRQWSDCVAVEVSKIPPPKPVKCLDCGLMSNDSRCCQNDEELWK